MLVLRRRSAETPETLPYAIGTVGRTRRVYIEGGECLGASARGLPIDGGVSSVKELECVLGIGGEFANTDRRYVVEAVISSSRHTLRRKLAVAIAIQLSKITLQPNVLILDK